MSRISKLLLAMLFAAISLFVSFKFFFRPPMPREELSFRGTRGNLSAVLSRQSERSDTLVVYLHGLGGTILEPYKNPSTKRNYAAAAFDITDYKIDFSSIDFGTPGVWVHDQDFVDITGGIKMLLERTGAKRIILAGSSMGGSAALTYAAKAPDEIKNKVIGVVGIYPVADFDGLYRQTKAPEITLSMDMAFGGGPEKFAADYSANSLMPVLGRLSPWCRIYIISAENDVVLPRQLQLDLAERLKRCNFPFELESLPSIHLKPPPTESFRRGVEFVLKPLLNPKSATK